MTAPAGSRLASLLDDVGDLKNYQRPFLILLAIFLVCYFSQLAGFSLSIDDEVAASRTDPSIWVAQGRWLSFLVERFIVPQPVVPFFPLFVFGALACAGYIIVMKAHDYRLDNTPAFLAFAMFSAFPTLYFILAFAANTVALGIGLLLTCISLYLFDRALAAFALNLESRWESAVRFAWQVAAGAAAIGAYQSLILLIAAGCCGLFILRYARRPSMSLREIGLIHAYLAACVLGSVALNFVITHGFQWALDVEPAYVGQFIQIDHLLQDPAAVIRRMLKEYWQVYGGKRAVYGFRHIAFPAIILLGLFGLVAGSTTRSGARVLFLVVYLLAITAIPFALNPLTNGVVPHRSLVAVPYVFWFFAAGAVLSGIRLVRYLAVFVLAIAILQSLHTFSIFQSTKHLAFERDMQLASQIYDRIATEVPGFDRSKTYRVDFYGADEFASVYPDIADSTLSASFFEWEGGNPHRALLFMKVLGYSNLAVVDETTRKALLPVVQSLAIWPADGSVRLVDDVVLVRLGQSPGWVHRKLME